jgi:hypothetical protein
MSKYRTPRYAARQADGLKVVLVTEQQRSKLEAQALVGGPEVRTVGRYVQEYNESFQYKFVEVGNLTPKECRIYDFTPRILSLVGACPEIRFVTFLR